jgi:hypothetical protein
MGATVRLHERSLSGLDGEPPSRASTSSMAVRLTRLDHSETRHSRRTSWI